MYRENLEPRKTLWAVAEVAWQDSTGIPHRLPATLEDTSVSGACIRVRTPISVGSSLTVKWHREQFSGVARNLRRDGADFLLGIRRDTTNCAPPAGLPPIEHLTLPVIAATAKEYLQSSDLHTLIADSVPAPSTAEPSSAQISVEQPPASADAAPVPVRLAFFSEARLKPAPDPELNPTLLPAPAIPLPVPNSATAGPPAAGEITREDTKITIDSARQLAKDAVDAKAGDAISGDELLSRSGEHISLDENTARPVFAPPLAHAVEAPLPLRERKNMQTKNVFSKLWSGRHENGSAPDASESLENPVNTIDSESPAAASSASTELLSCEDIYRASGILGAASEYGIAKIVDMLSSKHIQGLAPEVKRASVLMALDAAGTAVDHVLNDATRRQHALDVYEAGQQKLLNEFEARKSRENAALQAELERLTAHYAERTQRNLDQIAGEKEAFGKWQAAKEHEYQRIAEAVSLCGKQPAVVAGGAKSAEPTSPLVPETPAAKPSESVPVQAASASAN